MSTLKIWETVRAGAKFPIGFRLDERTNYQAVSFTTTAGQSAAFDDETSIITVSADAACALSVGADPTAVITDYPLPADTQLDINVEPGQKISVITTTTTTVITFDPASLFSGEYGYAWDPADDTANFQTDGTTPAAFGDPVGLVKDLDSGGARNLTQTTGGSQPIRNSTGGAHWDFDGTDDYFTGSFAGLYNSANGCYIAMAVHSDDIAQATRYLMNEGNSASANAVYVPVAIGGNPAERRVFIRNDAFASIADSSSTGAFFGDGNWNLLIIEDTGSNIALQVISGGVAGTVSNVAYTRSGTSTLNRTGLGALVRNTPSGYASFRVGRVFARVNLAGLSAGDKTDIKEWVASNNGIVLP